MYFEAVFQPSNGTEYNSDAADFVGKKVAIHEGWTLEEGPHKGQQCFYIPNSTRTTVFLHSQLNGWLHPRKRSAGTQKYPFCPMERNI
jgi:hypothetical protein